MAEIATVQKQYAELRAKLAALQQHPNTRNAHLAIQQRMLNPTPLRQWRVTEFARKLQQAVDGTEPYVTSEWFDIPNYRMGFKMYPNGDEFGHGEQLSLFFFIMKRNAKSDPVLRRFHIVITICDQLDGSQSIRKEYDYSTAIKREETLNDLPERAQEDNELGSSKFCDLHVLLNDSRFIANDCLLVKFSLGR